MIDKFSGPAFPFSFDVDGEQRWAHGMALRDYTAIQMAKAFVRYNDNMDQVAAMSYEMADALARASIPKESKDVGA